MVKIIAQIDIPPWVIPTEPFEGKGIILAPWWKKVNKIEFAYFSGTPLPIDGRQSATESSAKSLWPVKTCIQQTISSCN